MPDNTLEESLYHQLLTIYVLLDDGDQHTFKQIGLTTTQYNFLHTLAEAQADSLTVTEIADSLLCTRGNVTRLVKRLGKSGWVQIGNDANDQRLVRISLTANGKEKVTQAHHLHQASIQRRLAALSPAQRQQLIELTETAVHHLKIDLAAQTS